MGGCFGRQDKVEPLVAELDETGRSVNPEFEGPTRQRSITDLFWIILKACSVIVLLGLVMYCAANGNIYRVLNGYDNCGNICGKVTEPIPNLACTGADMTNRKFLLIKEGNRAAIFNPKNVNKECVESCKDYPGYTPLWNRCIPETGKGENQFFSNTGLKDFFHEVSEDLSLCWPEILGLSFLAMVLSFLMLLLLRYATGVVIWLLLLTCIVISIITSVFLWINWADDSDSNDVETREKDTHLGFAIAASIFTVVIIVVILVMRKKIRLVIQLFREAGKTIADVPALLALPMTTFVTLALAATVGLFFQLLIQSSGILTERSPGYYFKKDLTMKVARWYNLFSFVWFVQFCIACQQMIIAGAVAHWYFTRDKANLGWPILRSGWNLVRYHLGSVAIGSLLITFIKILNFLIRMARNAEKRQGATYLLIKCLICVIEAIESFIKFLSRNAYIEIAIYGDGFCEGGKRAFKVLSSNAMNVLAINSIGDFILFIGKVFIVFISIIVGTMILDGKQGLLHMWVPLTIIGVFAFIVANTFLTVYEMVIDSLFICFCEDCQINDGISRPYFMNRSLMEFVQNSKKFVNVGDSASARSR